MESESSENTRKNSLKLDAVIALLIVASTFLVYAQVGTHDFTTFDDPDYVSENPYVEKGLSPESIKWALGFPERQYWAPVAFISHMIDVQLFGMNAGLHHLMNLFYHILNSLLLYLVLRLMTGAHWRSAFVACLFALHPVNVDSVAWMAERKNVISTTFWILSMIAYYSYAKNPDLKKYTVVLITVTLGLMAKQMLITLPFVFLLLDFWPLGRFRLAWKEKLKGAKGWAGSLEISGEPISRLVMQKLPLFALCVGAAIVSSRSVKHGSVIITRDLVPMGLRVENAITSYVFYIWKMIFPHNLTFYYPYPESIPAWQVVCAMTVLLLATALVFRFLFRAPYLVVGWLWFLGTLVPVSGIIQGGLWPAIAERWAYVPYIGLFIMISWGASDLMGRWKLKPEVHMLSATAVLVVLAFLTWRQAGVWKDDITLYSNGIRIDPQNYIGHVNLGEAYVKRGEPQKGIPHFLEAIKLHDNDLLAWNNLAGVYKKNKQMDKAIYCYSQLLKYDPESAPSHFALGEIYAEQAHLDKAIKEFTEAVRLNPKDAAAYYNLGITAAKKGEKAEGIRYLTSALKIKPSDVDSHLALGVILMNEGKATEAAGHFREVLKLKPGNKEARSYLNLAMNHGSDHTPSSMGVQKARPGDPQTLYKAAVSLSAKGEYAKALEALFALQNMQPDNADVYYNIACIYAKQNMVEESLNWLNRALNKGFKDWKLIESDRDLDNIRDTAGYKSLISRKSL